MLCSLSCQECIFRKLDEVFIEIQTSLCCQCALWGPSHCSGWPVEMSQYVMLKQLWNIKTFSNKHFHTNRQYLMEKITKAVDDRDGCMVKCRWYADQSMRQAKTYQVDYFDENCEKKMEESCFLVSLLRWEVFTLSNNLNTISKVLQTSAAVSLVF